MGLKQVMKQSLGMAMTPQLQQAIKILQMSVMELQTEINNALTENPVLEETQSEGGEDLANIEASMADSGAETTAPENPPDQLTEGKDDFDWQNYIEQSTSSGPLPSTRNMNSDDLPSFEQILTRSQTLADHVMWQLRMVTEDDKELDIGEEIAGNLNEDGYLVALVEEIAAKVGGDVADVEAVLFKIQRFDPPGVAARNLQECLLIQAEILQEDDELEIIIEKHMAELENKNYPAIAKALDLSLEHVIELCKVIHSMEPRPGRAFSSSEPQYIVPDIYVIKVAQDFKVVLNEDEIPRLRISRQYQMQLASGALQGETKTYVKDKLKGALWLMKSIYQRQKTIYRVTEAIVRRQRDFFERGPQFLRPMILKDIAEELTLHESTISRVTTNKFVHTPHGIFELKYFFNSAISRTDGEDMASESVKQKIKELVSKEDAKSPLSDQQLADMLSETNIKIARRTVAKYREGLGILPSNKRKQYF